MPIWRRPATPEEINARWGRDNANGLLDMRVTEIGDDFLCGEMPVDERHVQPFGILHGGMSVVLAETLGSLGSVLCCGPDEHAVGLEVSATHLRPVPKGQMVRGRCTAVRIGRTVHVWSIELRREDGTASCLARLTTAVVGKGR